MVFVKHIFVCSAAGLPMSSVDRARAIAGVGLEGDRYAVSAGTFSHTRHNVRHVTVISREDIEAANATLKVPFTPAESRRNLVVAGKVDLLALIGREFSIGAVRLRGVEECTPCRRPSRLAGKRGFKAAFERRAGIRAEILSSGTISIGDVVS
jgi:MOSC domain-containing protein YiiM